ncbi:MAG: hypothetical protein HY303_19180 [Candidatus Wallbacteria bacterium]|nr:hypothetical protein [Candidatus Wallbacteria bacterium]
MTVRTSIACLLLLLPPVFAQGATSISIGSPTVRVDGDFRVELRLTNSSDLYAAGVDLVYDPTKVTLLDRDGDPSNGTQPSVSEGSLLDAGGTTRTMRVEALENGEPGRLVIGITRLGPISGASAQDERTLVSVGFHALAICTTTVGLENIHFVESSGETLQPATAPVGTIRIVASPANRPPAIALPSALSARPGLIVLDAAQSSDPDGDPVSYAWSQKSGTTVALSSTTAPAVTFTAVAEGTYGFALDASDGFTSSHANISVNVLQATDTPPRVLVVTPTREVRGAVTIGYSAVDAEGDPANVTVEFSTDDGVTFATAHRLGTEGEGTVGLAASPSGRAHVFVWSSGADLGAARQTNVRLRISPTGGTPGSTDRFVVDNSLLGVTARILEPPDGAVLTTGQTFRLRGAAFDFAGTALTNLSFNASVDGALGNGGDISATLLTLGSQDVTLTATDAQQRVGIAVVRVSVVPPRLPRRFAFGGRILSDAGTAAPEGSQISLFNPSRGISGSGRVAGTDGGYSATLGSLELPVAGVGDVVSVEFVDASGVSRALVPHTLVLAAADLGNEFRAQDLTYASATSLALARGLSLIALPSNPGTTAVPYTSANLLNDSGATFVARPAGGGFQVFLGTGLTPAFEVRGNEGYLVSLPRDTTLSFTGRAWPAGQRTRNIDRGLSAIGFPRGLPSGFTLGDVLSLADVDFVVDFEPASNGLSRAKTFLRSLGTASSPLRTGRGYLVRSPAPRTIELPSGIGQ